jgi:uncharacterized membrane protein YqhA
MNMKLNEKIELILRESRWLVIFGVVGTLLATITLFSKTTVELLGHMASINSNETAVNCYLVIKAVDHYLLASFLLVFAFGLYKLFIDKSR